MTIPELRDEINNLITNVIPLAEAHPCENNGTIYLRLLEGSVRRNLMRMQAVNLLCNEEKLADSALEITRNMLEDTISVEYIFSKGAEDYSRRFHTFQWVQFKEDVDFYRSVGNPLSSEEFPDNEKKIEQNFQIAISEYPDFMHGNKPSKSWIRRDVDQMLQSREIINSLGMSQIHTLAQTYLIGSRKTHFNPIEISSILYQDTWDLGSQRSLRLALLASSSSLVRLTTRYIDEISRIKNHPTFHDIGARANDFLDKLNTLDSISDV